MRRTYWIPGKPYPWRVRRTREGRFYPAPQLKAWQERVVAFVESQRGEQVDGPVQLEVEVVLQRPPSHLTSKGQLRKSAPREATSLRCGDATNHLKAIEDALKGVLWKDDRQVIANACSKRYAETGEESGARVTVQMGESR